MTDRDVLKRASDALRESTEPSDEELRKLRQRVLGGGQVVPLARAKPQKKTKTLRWVLPLAAAFIAGTALAASPGAWQGMLQGVERFLDIELLVPPREAAKKVKPAKRKADDAQKAVAASAAAAAPSVPEPVVEPSVVEPSVVEPSAPAPVPVTRTRTRTTTNTSTSTIESGSGGGGLTGASEEAKAASASGVDEARGPSRELTLYKAAHELHFGAKRYDEALRAWESYLALPSPTFALEARYNRALCLLRLGHYEEARAALRPFAEGRVLGGYRHDEAERLIQALDKRR